jgi:hypothetical protein
MFGEWGGHAQGIHQILVARSGPRQNSKGWELISST